MKRDLVVVALLVVSAVFFPIRLADQCDYYDRLRMGNLGDEEQRALERLDVDLDEYKREALSWNELELVSRAVVATVLGFSILFWNPALLIFVSGRRRKAGSELDASLGGEGA